MSRAPFATETLHHEQRSVCTISSGHDAPWPAVSMHHLPRRIQSVCYHIHKAGKEDPISLFIFSLENRCKIGTIKRRGVIIVFHILVVDDDKNTRMYFDAVLKNNGYTVSVAENGEEALSVMDSAHIDLVVLDIMMPKMDGYEFTKTLRECNNTLPILMVSAKQTPRDKNRGFAVGTDDYMTKPVDQDEFLYRIKALLRRAKIANERRIVVGDVVLDYDSLTVTKGDVVQELPQKEFLLLYKLLTYPGKIFTRIQLMDEIWGADSETGWETVTVHVGRLRRRFEGWDEFEIVSVRGLGYKAVKKV